MVRVTHLHPIVNGTRSYKKSILEVLSLVCVAGVGQKTGNENRDPAQPHLDFPSSDDRIPPQKGSREVSESDEREYRSRDRHVHFVIHSHIVTNNATIVPHPDGHVYHMVNAMRSYGKKYL